MSPVFEDPVYFTCKGNVALSLDCGETLFIPTGRHIPWDDRWAESDEDLRERLNPLVLVVLEAAEQHEAKVEQEQQAVADVADAIKPKGDLTFRVEKVLGDPDA